MRGIRGTYIYVCDDNLREYFAQHLDKFEVEEDSIYMELDNVIPFENAVPLYNLKAAAGEFLANEKIDERDYDWAKIPSHIKPSKDLFACTVHGESMNKIISNGSVCLFRKYSAGSREGKIVLAQHYGIQDSDNGSGYTVKEYHSTKENKNNEQWQHSSIKLKPLSTDTSFEAIDITEDDLEEFKVIGVFECVL